MNWLWTKDRLKQTPYKAAATSGAFNQYLQHGVGLTVGVGW
jgi:hypothetical protein